MNVSLERFLRRLWSTTYFYESMIPLYKPDTLMLRYISTCLPVTRHSACPYNKQFHFFFFLFSEQFKDCLARILYIDDSMVPKEEHRQGAPHWLKDEGLVWERCGRSTVSKACTPFWYECLSIASYHMLDSFSPYPIMMLLLIWYVTIIILSRQLLWWANFLTHFCTGSVMQTVLIQIISLTLFLRIRRLHK